jgi:ribosomal-protein-alanine N-acetyltransferase
MALIIRLFEESDFNTVCLYERMRSRSTYGSAVFIRQASVIFSQFFFVAEHEGIVGGYGIGALNQNNMEEGWVLRLNVDQHLRSRGIGRLLLEHVIGSLIVAGATRILLSVAPGNTSAIRLYERFGFLKTQFLANYFGNGEDRIIMLYEPSTGASE